jgi:hypothetical protein
MRRRAEYTFRQAVLLGEAVDADDAGDRAVLTRRFCFFSSRALFTGDPLAQISNRPVFAPSASSIGRTVRLCSRVRRGDVVGQLLDRGVGPWCGGRGCC